MKNRYVKTFENYGITSITNKIEDNATLTINKINDKLSKTKEYLLDLDNLVKSFKLSHSWDTSMRNGEYEYIIKLPPYIVFKQIEINQILDLIKKHEVFSLGVEFYDKREGYFTYNDLTNNSYDKSFLNKLNFIRIYTGIKTNKF